MFPIDMPFNPEASTQQEKVPVEFPIENSEESWTPSMDYQTGPMCTESNYDVSNTLFEFTISSDTGFTPEELEAIGYKYVGLTQTSSRPIWEKQNVAGYFRDLAIAGPMKIRVYINHELHDAVVLDNGVIQVTVGQGLEHLGLVDDAFGVACSDDGKPEEADKANESTDPQQVEIITEYDPATGIDRTDTEEAEGGDVQTPTSSETNKPLLDRTETGQSVVNVPPICLGSLAFAGTLATSVVLGFLYMANKGIRDREDDRRPLKLSPAAGDKPRGDSKVRTCDTSVIKREQPRSTDSDKGKFWRSLKRETTKVGRAIALRDRQYDNHYGK